MPRFGRSFPLPHRRKYQVPGPLRATRLHTTSIYIRPLTNTRTHTTDVNKRTTFTRTHSTDVYKGLPTVEGMTWYSGSKLADFDANNVPTGGTTAVSANNGYLGSSIRFNFVGTASVEQALRKALPNNSSIFQIRIRIPSTTTLSTTNDASLINVFPDNTYGTPVISLRMLGTTGGFTLRTVDPTNGYATNAGATTFAYDRYHTITLAITSAGYYVYVNLATTPEVSYTHANSTIRYGYVAYGNWYNQLNAVVGNVDFDDFYTANPRTVSTAAQQALDGFTGYLQRYFSWEGGLVRPIDPNSGDTKPTLVSEGMDYVERMAVQFNMQTVFNLADNWVLQNLLRSNSTTGNTSTNAAPTTALNLMGFSYNPCNTDGKGPNTFYDANWAGDAEIGRAQDLLWAHARWGSSSFTVGTTNELATPNYLQRALNVLADLRTYAFASSSATGYNYLLNDSFQLGNDTVQIGPDYNNPAAYRLFAQYDTGYASFWNNAVLGAYDIVTKAANYIFSPQTTTAKLMPNWVQFQLSTGTVTGTSTYGDSNYSYNAFRFYPRAYEDWLFYASATTSTFMGLPKTFFVNQWTANSKIWATYQHDGNNPANYEQLLFYYPAYFTIITNDASNTTGSAIYTNKIANQFVQYPSGSSYATPGYFSDSWYPIYELERQGTITNFGQATVTTYTRTHTTSIFKYARFTKTHTTDLVKRKPVTKTHTTDILKRKVNTKTHATDVLKRAIGTKTHTTDTLLRKVTTRLHTTDSLLRKVRTLTHTTDVLKRATNTRFHTTDVQSLLARRLNLLPNPSFETNLNGWSQYGGSPAGTLALSTDFAYVGTQSAKVVNSSANSGGGYAGGLSRSINLVSGQTYTISAWVYALGTQNISWYIGQSTNPGNNQTINAGWNRVSLTFVSTNTFPIAYLRSNTANATWYADAIMLETNNVTIANGDFSAYPTAQVATTSGGRFIDGTATGSATDPGYGGIIFGKSGTASAMLDSSTYNTSPASLKLSTLATGSYIEARLGGVNSYWGRFGFWLTPGHSYTLTFYMMTNYVSGDAGTGATVDVIQSDANGNSVSTENSIGGVKTTTTWTQYTINFTANRRAAWAHIEPRIYGHNGVGTLIMDAWFDDFVLVDNSLPTDYFDGDSVNSGWRGTAHAAVSYSAAVVVRQTHTTDIYKRVSFTRTHTTDVVKRAVLTQSHTTDITKRLQATRSHTTDTLLKFRYLLTHTTDIVKRKSVTKTHTTNILKRARLTRSHTTDVLKRAINSLTHSTDTLLASRRSVAHLTDILLLARRTLTHATDVLKRKVTTKTHTTNILKRKVNTRNHSTDILKVGRYSRSHTTSIVTRAAVTRTHTTDLVLRARLVRSHSTDIVARYQPARFHTTDINLAKTTTKFHKTDVNKRKATTKFHTTNILKRRVVTKTHSTDIVKRVAPVVSHLTDTYLRKATTLSHSTDVVKRRAVVLTHSTDTYMFSPGRRKHTTDVYKTYYQLPVVVVPTGDLENRTPATGNLNQGTVDSTGELESRSTPTQAFGVETIIPGSWTKV